MEDEEIGQLKDLTDEYYRLIEQGLSKRNALRKMQRAHKLTKSELLEIIEGWIEN